MRRNLQVLFLGKPGSGKSTLARAIFAHYPLRDLRDYYISISTKLDHYYPPLEPGKPNYEISLRRLGFIHIPIDPGEVKPFSLQKALWKGGRRLALTLRGLSPDEKRLFMDKLGKTMLELGHAAILIDECDELIPRNRPPHYALNLVRRGRYEGIDLLFVSHSDTGVHNEVVENCNCLITFAMKHPTRIERLRYYFEDVSRLAKLGQWEYLMVDDHTGEEIRGFSTDDLEGMKRKYPWLFPQPREWIRRSIR